MRNKRIINIIICTVAAVVLLLLCQQLYMQRFRGSDIYPRFSSLRSDPFGSKALFLSLERSGQFEVKRNMRPLDEIDNPADYCVFIIGAGSGMLRYDRSILDFAMRGGRVVVCYSPFRIQLKPKNKKLKCKAGAKCSLPEKKKLKLPPVGFRFKQHLLPPAFPARARPIAEKVLPEFDFYSSYYFEPSSKSWNTVYTLLDKPVMIQRQYGSGRLIVCSDSFLLSNEAMSGKPSGQLLLYLAGNKKQILFEETHLGSYKSRNIAWMVYRYNLQWFILALFVTVILFIWRSLLTPSDSNRPFSDMPETAIDNDSLAAPAGLFRKDYPAREMPLLCLEEFLQSGPGKRMSKAKCSQMKAECQLKKPLEAFNACVRLYKSRDVFVDVSAAESAEDKSGGRNNE